MHLPKSHRMAVPRDPVIILDIVGERDCQIRIRSESELFTGDTSKDNHSPGPVFREVSP